MSKKFEKWLICSDDDTRKDILNYLSENSVESSTRIISNPTDLRNYMSEDPGYKCALGGVIDGMHAANLAYAVKFDNPDAYILFFNAQDLKDKSKYLLEHLQVQFVENKKVLDENGAKTLAVISSSGGVGKSLIAGLFACWSAGHRVNTALIDADFQYGIQSDFFGCQNTLFASDLVQARGNYGLGDGFNYPVRNLAISGRCETPEESIEVEPYFKEILEETRSVFEAVVIDLPVYINDVLVHALEVADRALIVVDSTNMNVSSTRSLIALMRKLGFERSRIKVILNRATSFDETETQLASLSMSLGVSNIFSLTDGGREVQDLLRHGEITKLATSQNMLAVQASDWARATWKEVGAINEKLPISQQREVREPSDKKVTRSLTNKVFSFVKKNSETFLRGA